MKITDTITKNTATVVTADDMIATLNAWNEGIEAGYFETVVEMYFNGDQGQAVEFFASNGITID